MVQITDLPSAVTLNGDDALAVSQAGVLKQTTKQLLTAAALPDGDKGDITVSGTGTLWTIDSGLSSERIADGTVTNTEFQYLSGVTSDVQTQLDAKATSTDLSIFTNVAVSGQSDIVADDPTDTLNIAAGANIVLTTNAASDTLTIAATGAGIPTAITVADTVDATTYVSLFEDATGDLSPKTDAGLTYDATTGMLTATGLTGPLTGNADTVTTNANLTGPITSTGNATAIASQTGTGTKFVMDTSPTLVTPDVGVAVATSVNKVTVTAPATGSTLTIGDGFTLTASADADVSGTNTGDQTNITGNAATVTTNADLTGPITSTGNATSVASQTGTGSTFVMDTSPTLVTPALGTPSALVGTNISGTASSFTAGNVTTNANLTGPVTSVGNATTITADSVTYDIIQDTSGTDIILGRSTAGAGTVEEITCTSAGRALIDDADASAQRTTLGLAIGTDVQAYDVDTAKLDVTQAFSAAQRAGETNLTSTAASIAVNFALNNDFKHTFTENTTLANPTNIVVGQSGAIRLTQHVSSPKTLAFGSYWDFAGSSVPTVTATNSARDTLYYHVRSSTLIETSWIGDWG